MDLNQVITEALALEQIEGLIAKKKMLPKKREALAPAIERIAEAMVYGLLSINADGSMEQHLATPVNNLETIKYKARVEPEVINRELSKVKVDNQTNRNMVYLKAYSGLMEPQFNKLENTDREIADIIAFFFQ